jgi:radial spoke head protein 1
MEEEEGGPRYKFVTENGEVKDTSRGYTGSATVTYPNNDIYEGYFQNGIRDGKGEYRYAANGDKYSGEWKANFRHGIGTMIYNGKGTYQGYWENGRRHGEGMFTYPNGDIYSGWWRFGNKEGTGSYLNKTTGMKLYGQWAEGEMKTGRWIYPNGTYYEGEFVGNKPNGSGTWYFKNGNEMHGSYEQKAKGEGEEEEPEEEPEEEGGEVVKKNKVQLIWHAKTEIAAAAHHVNSVQQ